MEAPARPASGTPATEEASKAKSIVLFSDGTGNSSAKVFKTNVWRMYECVDLGPAAEKMRPQIAYYDDGVGTSSFKPLAALGGAFGWGLKRNVLDIYRYACRNYRDGDHIYVFGFSRGAFTARLVAALITDQGLVQSDNEADLRHKTLRAYRQFREPVLPRRVQLPTRLVRRFRDGVAAIWDALRKRQAYDASRNIRPSIRFVGVWDTVGAYGGPIVEITRAVDNWFFRLSMPDYKLSTRVEFARHALALDDERDAFHPLLWDEAHEEQLVRDGKVAPDRLRQVWFSGMHADVGGGYPDESLSYVSLLWMMEEAEQAGLRTLSVIKERILALASSYGPIHDSRSGLGSYYRYQPRKIAAWLHPIDERMLSLQDPAIAEEDGEAHGLLRTVRVHESVINRIATGTDRYAPITLPDTFEIVPPELVNETTPQPVNDGAGVSPAIGGARALIDPALRARFLNEEAAPRRRAAMERVWDLVWWRRLVYFATLAATLALLAMPLLDRHLQKAPLLNDGRTWIGGIIRLLTLLLPSFAAPWIDVYANRPFYFLLAVVVVVILLGIGTALEHRLRDRARAIWRAELTGGVRPPTRTWVQRFRNSRSYQRGIQIVKWRLLPDVVIAPLMGLVLGYLLLGGYTQGWLAFAENGTTFCSSPETIPPPIVSASREIATQDLCSAPFGTVTEGSRYVVTFDVTENAADKRRAWADSSLAASPQGLSASQFSSPAGYLGVPLRRVIAARYLQPVFEIRARTHGPSSFDVSLYPLAMERVEGSDTRYRAQFDATRTGDLFIFVNDAVLPFHTGVRGFNNRFFYRNNAGSALVTVEALGGAGR